MRDVAQRLVAEEFRVGQGAGTKGRAALRVCEKLRGPLGTLVGTVGFRSLLTRALSLARAKAPQLEALEVNRTGSLEISAEAEARFDPNGTGEGGTVLIAQLLELLVTFIGEALTLRLVAEVWPKAVVRMPKN